MKKIVYGICGIGNGHLYRQLPIIDFLLENNHKIMIFTYGTAFEFFNKKYIPTLSQLKQELIQVALVDVPYFIGKKDGLDFVKAAEINRAMTMTNNLEAFSQAQKYIGRPDLIISDYEPYSAQYGYAYDCPVVTIDQQSRYLLKSLPLELNGTSYIDEIMRLNMFFPKAEKRFACSFFKIPVSQANNSVEIIPTNIRPEILALKNRPSEEMHYIIYLTAQAGFKQDLSEIVNILKNRNEKFTIFLNKDSYQKQLNNNFKNIHFATHGDKAFEKLLETCSGIISTAGHTLLSEAMHLEIPVYAMPLDLYEQQLSAKVIGDNNFGINYQTLTNEKLEEFIKNNDLYRINIILDQNNLYKDNGLDILFKYIGEMLK
jgi:uncharacterized protein (TIGR00661 family)